MRASDVYENPLPEAAGTPGRRLRSPLSLCLACAAFAGLLAVAGIGEQPSDTEHPKAMTPECEVTVADAGQARAFFRKNAWFKEFSGSNLYRGAMVRLGPALFAVGRGEHDGWKDRLGDFLLDRVLAGRPMRVSYFSAPGLVSPFGITVESLSSAEKSLVHVVVESQRSGEDVPTAVMAGGKEATVNVTPISIGQQKFAVVEMPGSLAVSRDPDVAAALGARAPSGRPAGAAVVDVDLKQFFSSWSVVLEKRFGLGQRLRMGFDYESVGARFLPARAELPLRAGHLLGSAAFSPELLGAIPADALFFATVAIPDPGPLSPETAAAYLGSGPGEPRRGFVPVTLLFLGVHADDQRHSEPMSAILIPVAKMDEDAEDGIEELFNRRRRYEVGFSTECPGLAVISPSAAALARINEVCAGKKPSFRQLPPKLVSAVSERPIGAAAFLNIGGFLKSALALGWQLQAAAPEKAPPPELADAMALLDRLPMMAFSGNATGDALVMRGVEP